MKTKSSYLLTLSHGVIISALLFVITMVIFLPGGERVLSEVTSEAIYLSLAIYTFYYISKLGNSTIAFGWSLFCLGLAIDLSDEVSAVADVLHKNLEDWACMVGILIFALGFHRANENLTRSLSIEQKRAKHLADQAFSDELTGIGNRHYLLEELPSLLERSQSACLYFMDLNKFKPANDTYGHEIGDILLKAVASRLSRLSRHEDLLVRWGGDEFILVLSFEDDDTPDPMQFATRIAESFDKPFNIRKLQIELGASIGFALYPEHAKSREELIHKADLAMYESKSLNTGPCEFNPSLLSR